MIKIKKHAESRNRHRAKKRAVTQTTTAAAKTTQHKERKLGPGSAASTYIKQVMSKSDDKALYNP